MGIAGIPPEDRRRGPLRYASIRPGCYSIKDRVAAILILRTWTVPGLNDPDAVPLDVFASVLGGLSSSPCGREAAGCGRAQRTFSRSTSAVKA